MFSDKVLFQSDDSLKLSAESISTIISSMNNGDSQVKTVRTSKKKTVPTSPTDDFNAFIGKKSDTDDIKGHSEMVVIKIRAEKALKDASIRTIKAALESKLDDKEGKNSPGKTHLRNKTPVKRIAGPESQVLSEEESLKQRLNYERLTSTQTQVISQLQKHQLQKEDEGNLSKGQTLDNILSQSQRSEEGNGFTLQQQRQQEQRVKSAQKQQTLLPKEQTCEQSQQQEESEQDKQELVESLQLQNPSSTQSITSPLQVLIRAPNSPSSSSSSNRLSFIQTNKSINEKDNNSSRNQPIQGDQEKSVSPNKYPSMASIAKISENVKKVKRTFKDQIGSSNVHERTVQALSMSSLPSDAYAHDKNGGYTYMHIYMYEHILQ